MPGAPEEGGLGAVPPSKDPALPPGSSPCSQRLYPISSKCCRVMVPQRGRVRLPRPRCSLDAPSPLSERESRGSAAQPGRHKPAYSQRASAQMKFQRGACLGPRIFPGRVPAGYRQALHPDSPKPANTSRYTLGDNRIFQGAIQLISQCLDACQMLGLGALCRATAKGDQSSQSPKPSGVGSVEVASCSFGPGPSWPGIPRTISDGCS